MRIEEILKQNLNQEVIVKGWVRFNRSSKNIGFLEVFDGSSLNGIQVVYKIENKEIFEKLFKLPVWSAVEIKGILVESKQKEINTTEIINIWSSTEENPLGKKEHGFEFLREIAHLRPRTKTFQSIMKIRSLLAIGIHEFFSKENFLYVHSPIITSNDAEGAGESFFVKTKNNETFFHNQGSLTVSGQLHAESYAQAFSKVYTFGPTFRAENSNTKKHASEFWMIEPEVAFCDYNQMMDIAESQTKYVIDKVLKNALPELENLSKIKGIDLVENLNKIVSQKFIRISYREAIELLKNAQSKGVVFNESIIEFGIDLATEHEKYLSEQQFDCPVFVFDYPKEIKSFYMYQNDDNTVRGFDLLVKGIGELIGGSQRIDTFENLIKNAKEKNIDLNELKWYLELREQGYAPSSGYGLGFERLVMLVTGVENIRDVIPFPRTPGKLDF